MVFLAAKECADMRQQASKLAMQQKDGVNATRTAKLGNPIHRCAYAGTDEGKKSWLAFRGIDFSTGMWR